MKNIFITYNKNSEIEENTALRRQTLYLQIWNKNKRRQKMLSELDSLQLGLVYYLIGHYLTNRLYEYKYKPEKN